ncbi:MAG TPA: 5'-nucleotidase C-terminal domain-containing protein, partial [Clostridia bacterium]
IHNGDVTIRDISSIYVYENYLYSIKMTGKQLKDWLEFSARYYKQTSSPDDPAIKDPALNIPDYNLDQAYGVEYVIDITQPAGSRIKNLKYKGKPVKDDDTLIAAVNNYRYNGGGGFMAAAGLTPGSGAIYDSMKLLGDNGQVRNLIIDYVKRKESISPVKESYWRIKSTPDKDLEPDEIHVNAERLSDISVNIGDNTLVSIMNGTGTLIPEVDYKVTGNVITISKWYLGYYFNKFPDHNLYLKFNFENGKSSVLTVYTGDTPHVVLTPETLSYDVKSGDAGLGLVLNGNFISGIKSDDSGLTQRIDYSYAPYSQILYIRKGYLNTFFSKNTGPLKLTVYFTGDQPKTVVLSPVK